MSTTTKNPSDVTAKRNLTVENDLRVKGVVTLDQDLSVKGFTATENATFTIMEGMDEAAKLKKAMGK